MSWQKLKGKRTTQVIMDANGEIHEYVDDWTLDDAGGLSGNPHDPFNGEWTGWAEFEIEDEPKPEVQEETGGGVKRKAEEDQEVTPEEEDSENPKSGVKRKAEEEGDEERTMREEERMRTRNQRSEVTSGVGVKRKAEDEGNEERKRRDDGHDDDMNEIRQGLNLMGFNVDLVNWLLSTDLDIISELNEVRRAVRLYGKGQHVVQSHVSEAYSPLP